MSPHTIAAFTDRTKKGPDGSIQSWIVGSAWLLTFVRSVQILAHATSPQNVAPSPTNVIDATSFALT
jgi:hypothetical protein